MNALIAVFYSAAALILLLASMAISGNPSLHNPTGVLAFFFIGLFLSLGFLLFGHIRFDELLAETPRKDASQP